MKRVFLISALFCALFFLAACGGSGKSENETVKLGAPCSIDGEETCSVNGGEILICREQIWHTRDTCNLNFGEHCQKLPSGLYSCTAPKQENEKEKDSDDTDSGQKNDDDADSADDSGDSTDDSDSDSNEGGASDSGDDSDSDTSDSGNDADSGDDSDSDSGKKQGELYGECYPNKTCNEGLVCDVENNVCVKSGNDDDTDTGSDDDTDTGSDNDTDTGSDGDADSQPDDDTDTGTDNEQILEQKCNEAGGTWDSKNRNCTKTENCSGEPEHSVWNGDDSYIRTYENNAWSPEIPATYNETEGTCTFICTATYHHENGQCVSDTRTANCTQFSDEHAEWNGETSYTQTYSNGAWSAAIPTEYSETAGTCKYKCAATYHRENGQCVSDTRTANCADKPANSVWNGATSYTQTYTNGAWSAPIPTEYSENAGICKFKCGTHYNYNQSTSTCDAEEQQSDCADKPANTVWNDGKEGDESGKFIQVWNGSGWNPPSYASGYSETAGTCRYKCIDAYHRENGQCVSDTKTIDCTPFTLENAEWNGSSTYTMTYSNGAWSDAIQTEYSDEAGECRYRCKIHYTYDGFVCNADQQLTDCSAKPANSVWNDGKEGDEIGKFTQTWTGTNWDPATYASEYGDETGTCRYKCADTHYWYNSECLNPCDYDPCEADDNATPDSCVASSWQDYSCGCKEGYFWNQMQCKKITIGNICTGQTSCYDEESELETCPAKSEDFYGQDAQYLDKCIAQNVYVANSFYCGSNISMCLLGMEEHCGYSCDGYYKDRNTGLLWKPNASYVPKNWNDRADYCNGMNNSNDGEGYEGIKTWRVPNPIELLTVVDNSKFSHAMIVNFQNLPTEETSTRYLWTNYEHPNLSSTYAYILNTYHGRIAISSETNTNNVVLCVSGDELLPSQATDFVTSSDGKTVTDTKTGLMWQNDYATGKTWQEALAYCRSLNTGTEPYAGYTDWRLPNKNELASLLDLTKKNIYSNFPNMPRSYFWSSSTSASNTNNAWYQDHASGYLYNDKSKTTTRSARCVRNAE